MRVLIITRQYFPHGDATSNVVHNLAKEFQDRGWSVQVIALTSYVEDTETRSWEGVSVENIYVPCSAERNQIENEWKNRAVKAVYLAGHRIYSEVRKRTVKKCRDLTINPIFTKAFAKAIRELQRKNRYDLCIATLMPIEAVEAAVRALDERTVFSIYQLDTYWNNEWLPQKHQNERKEREKLIIEKADFVVTTPLIQQADCVAFPEYNNKVVGAEFPLIVAGKQQKEEQLYTEDIIHCIFLGRLYKGIRPPERVIEIIRRIKSKGIVFDFYGTGQHLISQRLGEERDKELIRLHGFVSSMEARRIQGEAHFLVNIDNTTTMQVPSKIFEYICTGKPILNFYFNEYSPTLQYFKKYPNCVNVFLYGDVDYEAKKMVEFIKSAKDKRVLFSEVKSIFKENTPAFVSDLFNFEYCRVKEQRKLQNDSVKSI